MGKTQSKSEVVHNNDSQVRIINNQTLHTELIENQEFLLLTILVLVVIQLALTIYQLFRRYTNKCFVSKVNGGLKRNISKQVILKWTKHGRNYKFCQRVTFNKTERNNFRR